IGNRNGSPPSRPLHHGYLHRRDHRSLHLVVGTTYGPASGPTPGAPGPARVMPHHEAHEDTKTNSCHGATRLLDLSKIFFKKPISRVAQWNARVFVSKYTSWLIRHPGTPHQIH